MYLNSGSAAPVEIVIKTLIVAKLNKLTQLIAILENVQLRLSSEELKMFSGWFVSWLILRAAGDIINTGLIDNRLMSLYAGTSSSKTERKHYPYSGHDAENKYFYSKQKFTSEAI